MCEAMSHACSNSAGKCLENTGVRALPVAKRAISLRGSDPCSLAEST